MATQYNYPTNYLRFGGKISPVNSTHNIGMLDSFYLQGGLKTIYSLAQITDDYNTRSWIPDGRRQTGSIIYVISQGKYYIDTGGSGATGYQELAALTPGGIPSFDGLILGDEGLTITGSGNIDVQNGTISGVSITASTGFYSENGDLDIGGDAYIDGTISNAQWNGDTIDVSHGGTGQEFFNANQILIGNGLNPITTIGGSYGEVLIGKGTADPEFASSLYLSGNLQIDGTASFSQITASTGFYSETGTLQIGGQSTFAKPITVTQATGQAPFYITSHTKVVNLNADKVDDMHVDLKASHGIPYLDDDTLTNAEIPLVGIVIAQDESAPIGATGTQYRILKWNDAGSSIEDSNISDVDDLITLLSSATLGDASSNIITSTGQFTASNGIHVEDGDLTFDNNLYNDSGFSVDSSGNLQCLSLKETSLRRYKHDIYGIQSPQLDNIAKLRPITFLYNQDAPDDVNDVKVRQAGFIAEQMEQIYPEVVWYKNGQLGGIQYQRLTAYLTKGIQELIEENKKLSHRLDLKDKAITKLNKQVKQLEQLMNDLLQRFSAQ